MARREQAVRIALQTVDGRAGQAAQRWHGRGNADAQERKKALGKDGRRDLQCGGDDERADAVRQNVLFDDAARAGAKSAGGGDVLALLQREHLAAHDAAPYPPVQKSEYNQDTDERHCQ